MGQWISCCLIISLFPILKAETDFLFYNLIFKYLNIKWLFSQWVFFLEQKNVKLISSTKCLRSQGDDSAVMTASSSAEDTSLVPRTYIKWFTDTCNCSSGHQKLPDSLIWIPMQKKLHVHLTKNNPLKII